MIKPLLIATKENGGILGKVLKKFEEKSPRTQIGAGWSLKRFIDADLKNYMERTHIILDISAFAEQDADFIELLTELQQKHEKAVIIIYADCYTDGDLFLHQLVKEGHTNIIAGYSDVSEEKSCELIQEDIFQCLTAGLSPQKYERFILPEDNGGEDSDYKETDKPCFNGDFKTITVFGSQSRIGTTTFAMGLCRHIIQNNGKAALVLVGENAEKECELMCKHLNGTDNGESITVKGIDVFLYRNLGAMKNYNLVVFDCGNVIDDLEYIKDLVDVDNIYLCCGVGWKELHSTSLAHKYIANMNYTVVVMNGDEETCEVHKEELCGNLNDYVLFNGDYEKFLK